VGAFSRLAPFVAKFSARFRQNVRRKQLRVVPKSGFQYQLLTSSRGDDFEPAWGPLID
jgi:hypothetical protein